MTNFMITTIYETSARAFEGKGITIWFRSLHFHVLYQKLRRGCGEFSQTLLSIQSDFMVSFYDN